MHGQGSCEAPSYGGSGHTEFVCPAHSGGVVTPSCHVDVSESGEVLQHEVEEEHACHFEVRIGNCARWIVKGYNGLADVIRLLYLPDDRGQGADSCKPDATCTKRGGVTKTHVTWLMYNEFMTVGWARCKDAK